MNTQTTRIIDRGRGPQLSTSRVTVQDLVPYFQEGCSYEEIIHWIPTLSAEEIAVVERYYREHQKELDEEDRLIRERSGLKGRLPDRCPAIYSSVCNSFANTLGRAALRKSQGPCYRLLFLNLRHHANVTET
jgi:uncharacterized protein (DUF433 family)